MDLYSAHRLKTSNALVTLVTVPTLSSTDLPGYCTFRLHRSQFLVVISTESTSAQPEADLWSFQLRKCVDTNSNQRMTLFAYQQHPRRHRKVCKFTTCSLFRNGCTICKNVLEQWMPDGNVIVVNHNLTECQRTVYRLYSTQVDTSLYVGLP